jgi:hypothetical protein
MSHHLCFFQSGKNICIQHFFPEAAIKTFHKTVLMWLACRFRTILTPLFRFKLTPSFWSNLTPRDFFMIGDFLGC